MTVPQQAQHHATAAPPAAPPRPDRPAPWAVAVSLFAGVLMVVTGILNAVQGVVALLGDALYVTTPDYAFSLDLTTWGWTHLALGLLVAAAGAAVLAGRIWGRIVGIAAAALTIIVNFVWIPYYPVWGVVVIVLGVMVIVALCSWTPEAARAL